MRVFIVFYALIFVLLFSNNKTKPSQITDRFVKTDFNNMQTKPVEDGKSLFLKYCLACHQTDGSGVPHMYPPIRKSTWVNGDKNKLILLLLNGMSGEIQVNDEYFDQTMPKFDYLTNEQIAKVLTYVRQNLENNAQPVTPKDVLTLRNTK